MRTDMEVVRVIQSLVDSLEASMPPSRRISSELALETVLVQRAIPVIL